MRVTSRPRLFVSLSLIIGALFIAPARGGAQSTPPDGEGPAPIVTPPRVLRFVEAEYPPEALEARQAAEVELRVTLGADGRVTEASVLTSAGEAFDAAALAAIAEFIFEPARRDLVPMAVRFRYVYAFDPDRYDAYIRERDGATAPELPPLGQLSGVVRDEGDAPLSGATVELEGAGGAVVRAVETGDEGDFTFEMLPPGVYRVRVEAGERSAAYEESVRAGEATELVYRVSPTEPEEEPQGQSAEEDALFTAEAVVDAPPREITRRTIRGEDLRTIPGTAGDALRAVEILPGVARPPFGTGALIVRGSAPGDSEVFFEGVSVPLLYHFGGLKSVVNSRLLESIDFYPGNFSSRYGRRTGGILEVSLRDPATDGFHGVLEASAIDVSLLVEGPITDNFSVAASARRSLIDLVFTKVVPDEIGVVAAPVYYDYQLFASWRPNPRDRVRFMVYGSSDRFELNLDDSFGDDPAVRGNARLVSRFNYQQILWDRDVSPGVEQELSMTFGPIHVGFDLGNDLRFEGNFRQIYSRYERRMQINPNVRLIVGSDVFLTPFELFFRGPAIGQSEGAAPGGPLAAEEVLELRRRATVFRPGFYFETNLDIDPVRVVLGTRVDYFSEVGSWAFNPRLSTMVAVTDTFRLKAGAGMYSQPPEFNESDRTIGNEDLEPIHSAHFGFGGDWDFFPGMTAGLEGFYKRLWNRVVATPGGVPPFFVNGGLGRIYGLELSARINPEDRPFLGYLSYTLSRSERLDHPDDPDDQWRLFDFDQTHIFTASFTYNFRRNWSLGGTVRIVSGNPNTPIIGSIYDALNDVYLPISGRINSRRNPLFHRLDIRVEKIWEIGERYRIAFFIDIQNAYNQKNQEGILYNFDYTRTTPINGLPIIPALGLRGEM